MRSNGEAEAEDQIATIDFLSRPSAYGSGVDQVKRIETHVSLIFLAGDYAYKLKRAVKLPYLDFSTAEQRRAACAAELALNRRTAPTLYLNLRRIGHDATGQLGFISERPAVDWVVVMRRFDQALLLDTLAREGRLDGPLMDRLADHVAAFHQKAEPRPAGGGAASLAEIAEANYQLLATAGDAGFDSDRVSAILGKWRAALQAAKDTIETRRAAGKVRRCHGDLHLRNICLVDDQPTLFDCLEFSDALATIDVLYDLAFLLMDLEHRGLRTFANRVLNRYLDRSGEEDGLGALPLFVSLRAGIRAHVIATALAEAANRGKRADMAAEARRYLDLAHRALDPCSPRLVAIGGLSGTGKSTLAAALAPELGPCIGARVLRSDVTRKLALGVVPETRLPAEAYSPQITLHVYGDLRDKAAATLAAGHTAIVDAVSLAPEERQSFAEVARRAGVPFTGLWLEADASAMESRIRERRGDASDATPEILGRQLTQDPGPLDWLRVDAGAEPEECLAAARRALANA